MVFYSLNIKKEPPRNGSPHNVIKNLDFFFKCCIINYETLRFVVVNYPRLAGR